MRKTLPIILLLFGAMTSAFAQQISNGGLENWHIFPVPVNFDEPDSFLVAYGIVGADTFVVKTTDAHSGMYAAEIRKGVVFPVPPTPVSGKLIYGTNSPAISGWPFTLRPDMLTFWYKYIPDGNDKASVGVSLRNGAIQQIIGSGSLLISSTDTVYSYAEVPIHYGPWPNNPDTIVIMFEASDGTNNNPNSKFWVDDIALDYSSGLHEIENNRFTVYPNPADRELRIKNAELKIDKIEIYDMLGERVFSEQPTDNSPQLMIDVSSLNSGVYFVRLTEGAKQYSARLMIQ